MNKACQHARFKYFIGPSPIPKIFDKPQYKQATKKIFIKLGVLRKTLYLPFSKNIEKGE